MGVTLKKKFFFSSFFIKEHVASSLYKMLFNFFFFETKTIAVYLLLPYRSLAKKGEFYGLVIATITRSLDGIRPQLLASNSYGEKGCSFYAKVI